MTEVKHLYEVPIFSDSVVNHDRAMLQFTYAGPLSNRAAHARKPREQFHMVEQSVAKTRGSLAVVFGNVPDDRGEVV